jgi:predicted nucleic acid-binding protein
MAGGAHQLVQRALQRGHLKLYLDTNFLLDLVRPKRRTASAELFAEACSRGWTCSSSYFAQMEALDVEQEHAWFLAKLRAGEHTEKLLRGRYKRDLTKRQLRLASKRFFTTLVERAVQDNVRWIALGKQETEQAMTLAAETNISAPDCLHVATALQAGCDVLVTSDDGLRDAARPHIFAVKPEELLAAIRAK